MFLIFLIFGIPIFILLYRELETIKPYHHVHPAAPPFFYWLAVLVLITGVMSSGSILGEGFLLVYLIIYLVLLGIPILHVGMTRFRSNRNRIVILVLSPLYALMLSKAWVGIQTRLHTKAAFRVVSTQINTWNRQASLSTALPHVINPEDIIVYQWTPWEKRIGLKNQRGQLDSVVAIDPNRRPLAVVKVLRVEYTTGKDLMVWPTR
ncbi:MAG: hypothetical protein AAF152_13470 [Cyanobacteria bacterium P01_A01_bin.114]